MSSLSLLVALLLSFGQVSEGVWIASRPGSSSSLAPGPSRPSSKALLVGGGRKDGLFDILRMVICFQRMVMVCLFLTEAVRINTFVYLVISYTLEAFFFSADVLALKIRIEFIPFNNSETGNANIVFTCSSGGGPSFLIGHFKHLFFLSFFYEMCLLYYSHPSPRHNKLTLTPPPRHNKLLPGSWAY